MFDAATIDALGKLGIGTIALLGALWLINRFAGLFERLSKTQADIVAINGKLVDASKKRDEQIDLISDQMQKDGEARDKQAEATEAMAADVKSLLVVNERTDKRFAEDRALNREMIERYTTDTNNVSSAIAAQGTHIAGAVTQAESNVIQAINGSKTETLNTYREANQAVQDALQELTEKVVLLGQQIENLKLPDPELAQMKAYLAEQITKLLGFVGNPAVDREQTETLQKYVEAHAKATAGFPVGSDEGGG